MGYVLKQGVELTHLGNLTLPSINCTPWVTSCNVLKLWNYWNVSCFIIFWVQCLGSCGHGIDITRSKTPHYLSPVLKWLRNGIRKPPSQRWGSQRGGTQILKTICFAQKYHRNALKYMKANNAKVMRACAKAVKALVKPGLFLQRTKWQVQSTSVWCSHRAWSRPMSPLPKVSGSAGRKKPRLNPSLKSRLKSRLKPRLSCWL